MAVLIQDVRNGRIMIGSLGKLSVTYTLATLNIRSIMGWFHLRL